jgi:hypothetical protein
MASNIDVAIPPFGNPTTLGVRANFAAAKAEIEALQELHSSKIFTMLSIDELVEVFQACAVNNVPQPILFNSLYYDIGGAITLDPGGGFITFNEAGSYVGSYDYSAIRKIGTGGLVDHAIFTEYQLPASGVWVKSPATLWMSSFSGADANQRTHNSIGFNAVIALAGTKFRIMQYCTDVTKSVGVVSIPASAIAPSQPAMAVHLMKIQ